MDKVIAAILAVAKVFVAAILAVAEVFVTIAMLYLIFCLPTMWLWNWLMP